MPTLQIDGMRVAYEDAGVGLPVVFIPGLVGSREWFRYQFSGLSGNYRILSFDLRMARSMSGYTLDSLVDDLARCLRALRLHFAVIVGHSFGAMVAQRFAVTHPEMTDALVLISAFPDRPESSHEALIDSLAPGPVHVESSFQSFLSKILPHKSAAPTEDDAEGRDWLTSHSPTISRTTLTARLALVDKFDSRPWLPAIEVPTLVMVGARDKPAFLAAAQSIYEGIPESELEVIEEGDHFCFYTRHDLVNTAIDEFIRERLTRL